MTLSHAWPSFSDRGAVSRIGQQGVSRQMFMLAFKTPESDHDGIVIPQYDHFGDIVCALLSVMYGKRFDNHGAIESSGFYRVPNLDAVQQLVDARLPHNQHKPRVDLGFELNLAEIERVAPLLSASAITTDKQKIIQGAAKFYLQALQQCERDIEVAYLHLITAGEILSNATDIRADSLYDASIRSILERIGKELSGGPRAAKTLSSRMRSVKRRFVSTFNSLTDDAFFNRSETQQPFGRLTKDGYVRALAAAYDLRSQYVHSGNSFGGWIELHIGGENIERMIGLPVVPDRKFAKTIAAAPTFVGLERIVRYGILRFGEKHGMNLGKDSAPATSGHLS